MAITRASLALLLITLMCSPVILAEDIAAEVVTTTSDRCTLEQKTDLVLLGLSLDEVNEKCGISGDKESQATVNNNTSTPSASDSIEDSASSSKPVFVNRHEPENFFLKFGLGVNSTSSLGEECAGCDTDSISMDFFSVRLYSNSIQPGSLGLHFNLNYVLPGFYAEYDSVDVYTPADDGSGSEYRGKYSYSLEYYNSAHFIGLEYIFGADTAMFYPGVAVLFGVLSQNPSIFDCIEEESGDSTSSRDSYCWDNNNDETSVTSMSGLSVTLYSDRIAEKGAGMSIGLTYLKFDDNDEVVDFSTTALEISGIW